MWPLGLPGWATFSGALAALPLAIVLLLLAIALTALVLLLLGISALILASLLTHLFLTLTDENDTLRAWKERRLTRATTTT
ncbi:hypothetical protein GCM10023189_43270 [Nibrella saemangeumensis]|uniref:Uncharacterized protein n=2 Tax=Nibrella saemangeumensis TaxID=1084526 RepID=A0ABP8NDT7_9BACT